MKKDHLNYKNSLEILKHKQESYYESINNAIELHLIESLKGEDKIININEIKKRRTEYETQISNLEEKRVDYMTIKMNLFSFIEELDRDYTNELKFNLKKYLKSIESFKNNISMDAPEIEIINAMDGNDDNKKFVEKNKSLEKGYERQSFKEYCQDINYYMENFDCLKKKKNMSSQELEQFQNKISQFVTKFLSNLIKEDLNPFHNKIMDIAEKIMENKCTINDYNYLENKFTERYKRFLEWRKNTIGNIECKKVGIEWEERFCYIYTFLNYINKKGEENKELDLNNFNFLCQLFNKILDLNDNEYIDFSLCNLVINLSSVFFTKDINCPAGVKYVKEVIKHNSIMKKKVF